MRLVPRDAGFPLEVGFPASPIRYRRLLSEPAATSATDDLGGNDHGYGCRFTPPRCLAGSEVPTPLLDPSLLLGQLVFAERTKCVEQWISDGEHISNSMGTK